MKHRPNKLKITLYLADECSPAERTQMERHLRTCAVCQKEAEAIRAFSAFIGEHRPAVNEETVITEMRNRVMRTIRHRPDAIGVMDRLRSVLGFSEQAGLRPVLAFTVVAVIAFAAAAVFLPGDDVPAQRFAPIAYDPYRSDASDQINGDSQVLNVQITSKDEQTGDIEFDVEVLLRSHVVGNMNDPGIQGILAKALISSQNPAVRLRAANVFNHAAGENAIAERSRELVKESLISALLHDRNHGVRLQALSALSEFMPDSAATSAVIRVLTTDKNSAIKIAAINTLDLSKYREGDTRNRLSRVLQDRSLNDENNYIRIKAKAALQEVQQ